MNKFLCFRLALLLTAPAWLLPALAVLALAWLFDWLPPLLWNYLRHGLWQAGAN